MVGFFRVQLACLWGVSHGLWRQRDAISTQLFLPAEFLVLDFAQMSEEDEEGRTFVADEEWRSPNVESILSDFGVRDRPRERRRELAADSEEKSNPLSGQKMVQ